MLLDAQLQFSASQSITVDAVSQNVIDLGTARQIGVGKAMAILISVEVGADATTGDETYSFELQTDDNAGFSSQTTLFDQDIPRAALTTGKVQFVVLPSSRIERYIRINFDVGGTTPSITVSCWLHPVDMIGTTYDYPNAYTVQ